MSAIVHSVPVPSAPVPSVPSVPVPSAPVPSVPVPSVPAPSVPATSVPVPVPSSFSTCRTYNIINFHFSTCTFIYLSICTCSTCSTFSSTFRLFTTHSLTNFWQYGEMKDEVIEAADPIGHFKDERV